MADAEARQRGQVVVKQLFGEGRDMSNATALGWNRQLAAEKFDGSKQRKSPDRPRINKELEDWGVRMAKENRS